MWAGSGGIYKNLEPDSSLLILDMRCKKVEVIIGREKNEFYTKQMVNILVDSLLRIVPNIRKIQITPAQPLFNSKAKGVYYIQVSYKKKNIVGLMLFDGSQFILPPYPEQIFEIGKNKKVSNSVQAERRSKRAAVIGNFLENGKNLINGQDSYNSFLTGYWWSYSRIIDIYYY
jgi:hypothetical protein